MNRYQNVLHVTWYCKSINRISHIKTNNVSCWLFASHEEVGYITKQDMRLASNKKTTSNLNMDPWVQKALASLMARLQ